MHASNASAFYAAMGEEPPSAMATYFLAAYPWLVITLVALSAVLLLAGVLRLAIRTKAKGRRLMLSGVAVLAATIVHGLSASPPLNPGGLIDVVLPKLVVVVGIVLFLSGFARMAWSVPSDAGGAPDA